MHCQHLLCSWLSQEYSVQFVILLKKLYCQAFISTSLLVSLISYKKRLPLLWFFLTPTYSVVLGISFFIYAPISQVDLVLHHTHTHTPVRAYVCVCVCVCSGAHIRWNTLKFFFWLEHWNNLEPKFSYCFNIYTAPIIWLSLRRICCIRRMKNSWCNVIFTL